MKPGQSSIILQLHLPSAQSLTTQLKHDLSLKHVRTHAGLEFATLETIVARGVAGRVRVWPRPRPRPRPRGVCRRERLGSSSESSCTAWQHFNRRATLIKRTSTIWSRILIADVLCVLRCKQTVELCKMFLWLQTICFVHTFKRMVFVIITMQLMSPKIALYLFNTLSLHLWSTVPEI